MANLWDDLYKKAGETAMMKFPFPIVMELLNFYQKKYSDMNPEDINVLEIGCGSGSNIKYAASLGFNVYGIDISETAVNYAIKSFQESNLKGNIQVASVDSLPFEDNFFHIVIDHGALAHVNEEIYQKAIDEIHRVLLGGGIALLTPHSEISTKKIKLFNDDGQATVFFKDINVYINNIGLYSVIKILNNRFKVLFLRRNDRVSYVISDDNKYINEESTNSVYYMFIEKL